jgi:hypothetical protein
MRRTDVLTLSSYSFVNRIHNCLRPSTKSCEYFVGNVGVFGPRSRSLDTLGSLAAPSGRSIPCSRHGDCEKQGPNDLGVLVTSDGRHRSPAKDACLAVPVHHQGHGGECIDPPIVVHGGCVYECLFHLWGLRPACEVVGRLPTTDGAPILQIGHDLANCGIRSASGNASWDQEPSLSFRHLDRKREGVVPDRARIDSEQVATKGECFGR